MVTETSVILGTEPTSLAFRASVLTITPPSVPDLTYLFMGLLDRGQCRVQITDYYSNNNYCNQPNIVILK